MPSRPPDLESAIDALYRRPFDEFIPARNALAGQAGAGAASIRQLAKPSLPAWAVNQLYWQKRSVFDHLLKATLRLRAVHVRAISGRPADLKDVEEAHDASLRVAETAAREFLKDAGEVESPATLTAISETLQAVLAIERPGRLVRPLKPLGFEALAGILKQGAPPLSLVKGRVTGGAASRPSTPPAAQQTSAADARRKIAAATREVAKAKANERKASAVLGRARRTLASRERRRTRLIDARDKLAQTIEEQAAEIYEAANAVREHEQAAARASQERARLEGDLKGVRNS